MDSDAPITCPQCEGAAFLLGILGDVAHFRCRYCGWDFSMDADSLDFDPREEVSADAF